MRIPLRIIVAALATAFLIGILLGQTGYGWYPTH